MSIKGKNTKSIRKKSLNNTRLPVVGTKSILFFHEATLGEQYIDITNLVLPSGHVNPSPAELTKARLKDFEENFELVSSAKGRLMKPLSYEVVTNTTIKLKFEADQGEIFEGKLHNYTVNGTIIADVRTPSGSGTLLESDTDFNLGEAIPIKDLSNQWPIQVYRGTSGTPMLRNVGNAPLPADGNYEMLDRGDGYCQVIRFNVAGGVGGEPVFWASHGALGERPNLSTLQQVDKIHGIMDRMREDLLVVTGNDVTDPTRYDGGVPTQSDLKAFGDLVYKIENMVVVDQDQFQKTTYAPPSTNNSSYVAANLGTETQVEGGLTLFKAINATDIEVLEDCFITTSWKWVNGGVANAATKLDYKPIATGTFSSQGGVSTTSASLNYILHHSFYAKKGDVFRHYTYLTHNSQTLTITAKRTTFKKIKDLI